MSFYCVEFLLLLENSDCSSDSLPKINKLQRSLSGGGSIYYYSFQWIINSEYSLRNVKFTDMFRNKISTYRSQNNKLAKFYEHLNKGDRKWTEDRYKLIWSSDFGIWFPNRWKVVRIHLIPQSWLKFGEKVHRFRHRKIKRGVMAQILRGTPGKGNEKAKNFLDSGFDDPKGVFSYKSPFYLV